MNVDVHVAAAVECAWWLAVRLRACRAQSAECLEGTVCRVGARILEEAQAGAQPETVFVPRAGTG
jgi:hypothetical protein